jgi:manganese efflux pump family protein
MNTATLILIAIGLAMDAFAVSIATSMSLGETNPRQLFRLAFHFGLFQALMPVLGWLAGTSVSRFIAQWDHWIAFGLLALVGARAIHQAFADEETRAAAGDPTRGRSLLMLSVATSIDAFAVGLSLAVLDVDIWYASLIIGLVTAGLTTVGFEFGKRLGARFGRRVEVLGGLILIAIGVRILVEHMGWW